MKKFISGLLGILFVVHICIQSAVKIRRFKRAYLWNMDR